MGPISQFLTGAFPALFGGAMSNNDTASGYAMAREQAMGRIGLVWRRMKFFHADIMLLAVDCFRRNRPHDVEVTLLGAGSAFESKWIRLADLKGNLFSYPETDEQYPTLWSQQRAVLMQMMGSPDPQMQTLLSHPENMALIKRLLGLEEFVIPDEESRNKQYREIAQLVAEAPVVRTQDVTHLTGTASEADVILPSVLPDEFADNHAVELEICMRWFSSDAGQVAKVESPLGYANVRAHAMFHREYLLKQQAATAGVAGAPKRK
jgi:crotonobetainyl-CoA:carnitine CoA-transferase CaiB-like acyl-CoA transferase